MTTSASQDLSARMPLVSVVIPCFNYGHTLAAAIESVLTSTYRNVEILVVDDGSTDAATREVFQRLDYPRTRVIHQKNKGLPGARNTGIRESGGTYVMCLDADDLIQPTFIEKGVWILETMPDVGFVTVWVELFGDENYVWRPARFNLLHWMFENLAPATGLVRRQAVDDVGGYDEKMTQGYEDWDFWLRVAKRGWLGHQIPEPLLRYRRHGITMLHESREHHQRLVARLRANHGDLFNRRSVARLKQTWGSPPVSIPARMDGRPLFDKVTLKRWLKENLPSSLHTQLKAHYREFRHRHALKRGSSKPDQAPDATHTVHDTPSRLHHLLPDRPCQGGNRTRVLLVVPWLEVGGADKVNLDLVAGLDRDKYAITIVTTLDSSQPWWDRFHAITSDIFHLPSLGRSEEEMYDVLRHIIRTRQIQIIQVSQSAMGFQFLPSLKREFPDIPAVSLLHMYVPTDPIDYVRVAQGLDEHIDVHVAITRGLKQVMTERLGFDPAKVHVIENGVDEKTFKPCPRDEDLLAELQIPASKRIVSFVGRLVDQKAPARFIEMARMLADVDYYDDIRFLVVGDGPLWDHLQTLIDQFALRDRFMFTGPRRDIARILSITDVLVAPSLFEGLPILGLEAMAAGTPVVASRVVGWQDLITHEEDGLLAEVFDTHEMARLVLSLLREPSRVNSLITRARTTIESRYTLDHFVNAYRQLWQGLLPTSCTAWIPRSRNSDELVEHES